MEKAAKTKPTDGGVKSKGYGGKTKNDPLPTGKNGYPQTGIKTSGVKVRGTGAAVKGTLARGPMG